MQLNRILLLGLALAALSGGPAAGQQAAPPNVLLILSDDHSAAHLGCDPSRGEGSTRK